MTRFVEVAVDFKSEPAKTFTYVVPDNLDTIIVGSLIRVPFGSREINGVVFKAVSYTHLTLPTNREV